MRRAPITPRWRCATSRSAARLIVHKKAGVCSHGASRPRNLSSLSPSTRPGRPQTMTEAIPVVAHDSAEQVVTEHYQHLGRTRRHRIRPLRRCSGSCRPGRRVG